MVGPMSSKDRLALALTRVSAGTLLGLGISHFVNGRFWLAVLSVSVLAFVCVFDRWRWPHLPPFWQSRSSEPDE